MCVQRCYSADFSCHSWLSDFLLLFNGLQPLLPILASDPWRLQQGIFPLHSCCSLNSLPFLWKPWGQDDWDSAKKKKKKQISSSWQNSKASRSQVPPTKSTTLKLKSTLSFISFIPDACFELQQVCLYLRASMQWLAAKIAVWINKLLDIVPN